MARGCSTLQPNFNKCDTNKYGQFKSDKYCYCKKSYCNHSTHCLPNLYCLGRKGKITYSHRYNDIILYIINAALLPRRVVSVGHFHNNVLDLGGNRNCNHEPNQTKWSEFVRPVMKQHRNSLCIHFRRIIQNVSWVSVSSETICDLMIVMARIDTLEYLVIANEMI